MGLIGLALFQQHYNVSYAPRGVTSWVFYGISVLVVIVVPVIIGLAMQNFWIEDNYFYQTPEVRFTNRCALAVRTVKGREMLWTCNEGFNEAYTYGTEYGMRPFFSLFEDDRDANGKHNDISFTLSVPIGDVDASVYQPGGLSASDLAFGRDAIESVTFLPEFVYRIHHYLIKLNMTAAPLLTFARSTPVNETELNGSPSSASLGPLCAITEADMLFHSTERLINAPHVHYTDTYTSSPLEDFARQPADLLNLRSFARYYTARNQSVVPRVFSEVQGSLSLLDQTPAVSLESASGVVASSTRVRGLWEDLDGLNSFTWRVRLRVPKAQIMYVPSYAEALKWGWVQYFVIAYLIQWFMWLLRGLVVTLGLLDTKAVYSTREVR